jgi:peptide/nickel transport system permease protein
LKLPNGALAGILILALGVVLLLPLDSSSVFSENVLAPSSINHPLGTDQLGREVLTVLVLGTRSSLVAAGQATFIAFVLGTLIGLLTEVVHARVRNIVFVILDASLAVPQIVLSLVVITAIGLGLQSLLWAIGVSYVAYVARFTASALRAIRPMPFIEAAEALGARRLTILRRHMLPNAFPSITSAGVLIFAYSLISISALSYLGFSTDPLQPDLGRYLLDGIRIIRYTPVPFVATASVLTLIVFLAHGIEGQISKRGTMHK